LVKRIKGTAGGVERGQKNPPKRNSKPNQGTEESTETYRREVNRAKKKKKVKLGTGEGNETGKKVNKNLRPVEKGGKL